MKVYLIGAGPGDPGLLTIKGRDILARADVVVYDYLANEALLAYAREGAELLYAGKKGGDHSLPQEEINALIVSRARAGKMVARLKGGDPYMFGRGGEEAEELLAAGLAFEVVPGVTSGIAGPAYAGIPLTHRAYSSSVCFITGHEDPTKPDTAHNWDALAKSAGTLVFYMGMKNLPDISRKLIDAGMPQETPAALVHWGTTAKQRSMVSSIAMLPKEAERLGFSSPSLIIVGGVVNLRDKLNYFEKRPLLGKGIVVTRAREQASDSAALLAEMGAEVIQFPTIEIVPLADYSAARASIGRLSEYALAVFTSVNAVRHFWEQLHCLGRDTRALAGLEVAAIGPATAEALKKQGIVPDLVPEHYVAEDIARCILERYSHSMHGLKVLLPRARAARDVLPEKLGAAGARVDVLPIYETLPAQQGKDELLKRLEAGEIHCITFASSSTVTNFLSLIPTEVLQRHPRVRLACIGPVTAATLEKAGLSCHIMPAQYTIAGLVRELAEKL